MSSQYVHVLRSRRLAQQRCGCGKPITKAGYLCDKCRDAVAAFSEPVREEEDPFAQQHALQAKLRELTDEEWHRVPILGLPARLLSVEAPARPVHHG